MPGGMKSSGPFTGGGTVSGGLTPSFGGKSPSLGIVVSVFTDERYVYDPRLSSSPIPKGDWEQHIKGMNPDGVRISDKLKGL